jgi:SH3 domain protein
MHDARIRQSRLARAALAVATILAAPMAAAETVYVTDELRLGLHRAEDTSDLPFRTLSSGDRLEVLERATNYALVRTEDGAEGWVKSAFLIGEAPARFRLAQVEAELEAKSSLAAGAEAAIAEARERAGEAEAALLALREETAAATDRLARLESEHRQAERRLEAYRGALPLTWSLAAAALALVAGFVGGLWFFDRRSRARHGGFRVY